MYWFLLLFAIHHVAPKSCRIKPWSNWTSCCHSIERDGDLPFVDEVTMFPEGTIFFVETSCMGGLDARQACSVESAAKANPHRHIVVLFTGPVFNKKCRRYKTLHRLRNVYTNISPFRVHLTKFSNRVLSEPRLIATAWEKICFYSSRPYIHTSHLLRLLTLYRYGGIYLDLDMIVTKSFDLLPEPSNWVGKESANQLGTSVIAMSRDAIGKDVANSILRIIYSKFQNNYATSYNEFSSIKILTEALTIRCLNIRGKAKNCSGFLIYPQEFFYPIPDVAFDQFLISNKAYPSDYKYALAFHTWNTRTQDVSIKRDSLFGRLVQDYCPETNKMFNVSDKIVLAGRKRHQKKSYRKTKKERKKEKKTPPPKKDVYFSGPFVNALNNDLLAMRMLGYI